MWIIARNTQSIVQNVYIKNNKHKISEVEMNTYYYVGYGKDNKGIVSHEDGWKRLNGGKRLSKSQMKLLQMKVYKVVKNAR
tara:strand:- start:222 stop:464 length:243 start_codon:yes stop_codon:yes gene_type:complete